MRVLVTGAAGFIGSHVAERLANQGDVVTGIDCFTDYYSRDLKELNAADVRAAGATLLELDLARDDLAPALDGVELVYHCAAQPGIAPHVPFEKYVRNNVLATQRLLEACCRISTLSCFVNVATSSIYGSRAMDAEDACPRPVSHYGVTKLAAEATVMAYQESHGLPACSFRLFSVYGPRERPEKLFPTLIRSILDDKEFPLCEGSEEHSRSFSHVDDVVDGLLLVRPALNECIGEIFNLGSDAEFRTIEAIQIIEGILGKKPRIRSVPGRIGDQLRTRADITKIRTRLGWSPTTSLVEGLRAEVDWFRRVEKRVP